MHRRTLLAALTCALVPVSAVADESVAGQWLADLGHTVKIEMDVLADGYWTSRTIEGTKVVAEMSGSYKQTKTNGSAGTLVFTPVKSRVTTEHGAATVETDHYSLQQNGSVLKLVSTTDNNPMVFQKQSH